MTEEDKQLMQSLTGKFWGGSLTPPETEARDGIFPTCPFHVLWCVHLKHLFSASVIQSCHWPFDWLEDPVFSPELSSLVWNQNKSRTLATSATKQSTTPATAGESGLHGLCTESPPMPSLHPPRQRLVHGAQALDGYHLAANSFQQQHCSSRCRGDM